MRPFAVWLALVAAAITLGIAVPYGLMSGGGAGIGIFAFWCLFGLVTVALIVAGTRGWRG